MKRLLKLLVVGALLALALVGCGEQKTPAPTPTPAPDATTKEGQVNDTAKTDLTGVFNKTYTIGKTGEKVYGTFDIGNPSLMHKTDAKGKAYIEVMVPLKLTNEATVDVEPATLLNGLLIDGNYNPYADQLKLRCTETGAIIKGNTDKDNKDYFVGLFNKDLKMVDGKAMLAPKQSVTSYFKYIVTTDDIDMDKLTTKFNDLTLSQFEFIINAKDGNGYTIVK